MKKLYIEKINTIKSIVEGINFFGKNLLSINDLSNSQIYELFKLANILEPWNRTIINLLPGKIMATLFFQPSTRTRMSFETAMYRLGGAVITESMPLIVSSMAKEESLADMIKVVSKYANIIVLRHFHYLDALECIPYSESPIINGGFGDWEHPTQALLDLYTLWQTFGRVEGLKVCIACPNMIEARTGHSMAYGLARLGARVTLASPKKNRTPDEIINKITSLGKKVDERFDLDQDSFNEMISGMDMVYLPGCSAPKGPEAEPFKIMMDNYYIRLETLKKVFKTEGRIVYVTHTLPRRPGEMDLRIDNSPSQIYFNAIAYSISIRMALLICIIGL